MRIIKPPRQAQPHAGAPLAQLFKDEQLRPVVTAFVKEVVKQFFRADAHTYIIDNAKMSRMEVPALMYMLLTRMNMINQGRTIRPFCEFVESVAGSQVISRRNNVGQMIETLSKDELQITCGTDYAGTSLSESRQQAIDYYHHAYHLLKQILKACSQNRNQD